MQENIRACVTDDMHFWSLYTLINPWSPSLSEGVLLTAGVLIKQRIGKRPGFTSKKPERFSQRIHVRK